MDELFLERVARGLAQVLPGNEQVSVELLRLLAVDGRPLFTWCAFDTLIYPPMLGRAANVESRCAATGAPIRIVVTPTGVERVDPTSVVVSMLVPEREAACCDVRSSFCNHVHFFRSADAARAWLDEHRDGAVLSVREAFDLGRRVREHCEGAVA